MVEDVLHRVAFHDMTVIHDQYVIRDFGHHAQIVGNEQHRQSDFVLESDQQTQNLSLHGNVQCRGRFIGDKQAGLAAQGDGNHRSLQHATAQLMRVGRHDEFGVRQFDTFEPCNRLCLGFRTGNIGMGQNGFNKLVANGEHRVKGMHRFLEDEPDIGTSHLAHLLDIQGQQITPFEQHFAGFDAAGPIDQIDQRHGRGAFPGTGFADQTAHASSANVKADVIHGFAYGAVIRIKVCFQVAHTKYDVIGIIDFVLFMCCFVRYYDAHKCSLVLPAPWCMTA